MKVIDAHMHFSNIESFKRTAAEISRVDYSSRGLRDEYADHNVALGIGMGLEEESPGAFPDCSCKSSMGLDLEYELPENVVKCIGINPFRLQGKGRDIELERIEADIKEAKTAGIKIYAGYYPFYVYDEIYIPVYRLAAKYNLTVVIHSGDTFSERGLIKYSHPLTIDEAAVRHRDVTFVIAHMGDPWIMETAELVYKNDNLYADMSGLIVGDAEKIRHVENTSLLMDHFKRGLVYTDDYKKYLFGSDWPLVPMGPYIDFIKLLVPEEYHERVFYYNALDAFPKIKDIIKP